MTDAAPADPTDTADDIADAAVDGPAAADSGRGGARVMSFCVVLLGLVTIVLGLLGDDPTPVRWGVVALVAALYVGGELLAAEIEFRHDTHTFSFTSVPLVIGLLLVPLPLLVAVRVAASFAVLGVIRRQAPIKLALNLASHALEVATAGVVVRLIGVPGALGPRAWLAAAVAVICADLLGAVIVTTAISLFQGFWEPSLLAGVWAPLTVAVVDISLAVTVATGIHRGDVEVWLALPVGVFMVLLTRAYARIRARYHAMERLDSYARELGGAVALGHVEESLLRRIAEVLHADTSWIWSPDHPESPKLVFDGADELRHESPSELDRSTLPLLGAGARLFPEGEAIVECLDVGEGRRVVIGVADRSGAVRDFDHEDVVLFNTLCSHAAVSLRNVGLVDQLRAESAENEYLATHDPLTGLANWTLFGRHVDRRMRNDPHLAVLLIDLDRFKEVNDTLGHASGDELLVEVGRRLGEGLGPDDLLARLGGDEFAVLVAATDEEAAIATARDLLGRLRHPFTVAGVDLDVDASVGVALPRDESDDAAGLLRQADVAMYAAKADHSGVATYAADRDHYSPKRLALVGRLRRAIDHGELELHYQPQVHLATGRVEGVEALVRWRQPGRGLIAPAEFIDVAERTDLIHPLTRFVLAEAVGQAARWRERGIDLPVSVNVSARNLGEDDLVDAISALLSQHGLPPESLEIELTETTVMSNPERAATVMARLRTLGVRIAIDDFGTGHSSLAYLTTLDVDRLKIDQSFIRAMATDPTAETVAHAVVDLAHNLHLEVVAEGVETAAAVRALQRMGCSTAQGYLYSRPVPGVELEMWLSQHDADRSAAAASAPA